MKLLLVLLLMAASLPGAEWRQLFNGKDLTGWDGLSDFWSVKDGAIRGQTTKEKPTRGNTFCIYRGGPNKGLMKNFVLKLKFRIQNGNSGVQYRSFVKDPKRNKYRVAGYQAEVENRQGKVGFLYDEARRGWLVNVGDMMVLSREGNKLKKEVVGKVADKKALIEAGYYKMKDWNEYTITCRGNHIVQCLNGYQTVELIDDDPQQRTLEGYLALQIHAGGPMVVEFKDIRVKYLKANYGSAIRLFNGKDLSGWEIVGSGTGGSSPGGLLHCCTYPPSPQPNTFSSGGRGLGSPCQTSKLAGRPMRSRSMNVTTPLPRRICVVAPWES